MNQRQLQIIDYLREENRVLREQLGGQRVRLDDPAPSLAEVATIVTPGALLARHRKLNALKYDGYGGGHGGGEPGLWTRRGLLRFMVLFCMEFSTLRLLASGPPPIGCG